MWKDYLRLVRLPNLFTAVADIVAGHFIAGALVPQAGNWAHLLLLCLASACLYAGGVALNDLLDIAHDRKFNPTRPLPSGKIRPTHALILVCTLFTVAISLTQLVSMAATVNALTIVLLIIIYDRFSRRLAGLGPINMGLIRASNLLMGMQLQASHLITEPKYLPPPLVMLIYVAGLTFISLSEEVSPKAKALVKYLVIGIIFLDALLLTFYGQFLPSCATLGLVVPTVFLARRFYVS